MGNRGDVEDSSTLTESLSSLQNKNNLETYHMKYIIPVLLCCTQGLIAADKKEHTPHDAVKLGIKLLNDEKYELFFEKMFTEEVKKSFKSTEGKDITDIIMVLKEKKKITLKRLKSALKKQPKYGTYGRDQRVAFYPFEDQTKNAKGFLLWLENGHYKYGTGETVNQSGLDNIVFD